MKQTHNFLRCFLHLLLAVSFLGCYKKASNIESVKLAHLQILDRNGFSETISSSDRLKKYENSNFLEPQPYKKVVQVFQSQKEGKPYSKIYSYHENGYIYQSLETISGRARGFYKEWYPSGSIKLETRVIEGIGDLSLEAMNTWVFDGESLIYDEKGSLAARFFYDKGILSGEGLTYYPSGTIKTLTFYKNNQEEGQSTEYTEEQTPLMMTNYLQGRFHGERVFFGTKTKPRFQELYKHGELHEAIYFSLSGEIVSSVKEKNGIESLFSDEGLVAQYQIANGKKEGFVHLFFPSGKTKNTYFQINGEKHGEELIYYETEKLESRLQPKIQLSWYKGKLQGRIKTWYKNGALESEREYYENKKNGPASAFYQNGQLMLLEDYQNDQLHSGLYWKKGDKKEISSIDEGEGIATIYDSEGVFLKKITYQKGVAQDE